MKTRGLFVWLVYLWPLFVLGGCATYSRSFLAIERSLAEGKYDEALKAIEERANDKTNRLLYLLDRGMVLRMKRDYAASNAAFESAKQEIERLYAASVSENALSVVVNDATVSYSGDDYEQALVHLYMALNYLELGRLDEARVEALQMDVKLRELGESAAFTEDALSRYLACLIYQELREWSDAMVSCRRAYEAYQKYAQRYKTPMPEALKHDLVRLAKHMGMENELNAYLQEFHFTESADAEMLSSDGEFVFVLHNGLTPIKREHTSHIWVSIQEKKSTLPIMVSIALPHYQSRPLHVLSARIRASGNQTQTQLVEDIDAIARATLEARMPAITARATARAIAKVKAQMAADKMEEKQSGSPGMLGLLARVAADVTEHADTRSWLTLPANIQMARLPLPPGEHDVEIDLLGKDGEVLRTLRYPKVTIHQERKTYVSEHVLP